MKTLVLPNYVKDIRSRSVIIKRYKSGADFILRDVTSQYDGMLCSIRDFPDESVKLRYNKLKSVVVFLPGYPKRQGT